MGPFVDLLGAIAHAGDVHPQSGFCEFWTDTLELSEEKQADLNECLNDPPSAEIKTLALRLVQRFQILFVSF